MDALSAKIHGYGRALRRSNVTEIEMLNAIAMEVLEISSKIVIALRETDNKEHR